MPVPNLAVDGGWLLVLTRSVTVAALLCGFGTLVFRSVVAARVFGGMPAARAAAVGASLLRQARWSLAVAVAGLLAWFVLQAGDIADVASPALVLAALPGVLTDTMFGHLVAGQGLAVLAALALLWRDGRWRRYAALAAATVALGLQAGHSHAASMYGGPSVLLGAELVHLLGAGAWLGGLLPLLLLVRDAPAQAGALAARWFSPLGKLCLVGLTASALFQGWVLVGSVAGLVGTGYGWMVLVKLGLFGVLFGFAVVNRYRLAPALLRGDPVAAKRALVRSIAVQTGFGLAIVVAAGVLSSLPPAMHVQPVWPFADRFSLDTVNEDPAFFDEALLAALALGGAAVLLVLAGFMRRRLRLAAMAAAAVIAWLATPHLDLLLVPAYPTSFYQSPTAFAATSIDRGAALYPQHCAACHGAEARGDGPAGRGLPVPPADLTAAHLWMHRDGELFWWLSHGIEAPEGGMAMPGLAAVLSEDDRWHLIDYIRAHNAGVAFATTGAWSPPLRAPELQAQCGDGRTVSLADLRGGFVRLVIGGGPVAVAGTTTILATRDPARRASPGLCIADDAGLPEAYAIVSGRALAELPGTEFLIDGDGWLRAAERPGWNDTVTLQAAIAQLAEHPVAAVRSGMQM